MNNVVKDLPKSDRKKILRQEVSFQRLLYPEDAKDRPDLYKLNFLNDDQLLENITILLENPNEITSGEKVDFQSSEEIMEILKTGGQPQQAEEFRQPQMAEQTSQLQQAEEFTIQKPLAVVWDDNEESRSWFIGFYIGESANNPHEIAVDHLVRKNSNSDWIRPVMDDVQDVKLGQIVPVPIIGE